jgi:hypothetical protein
MAWPLAVVAGMFTYVFVGKFTCMVAQAVRRGLLRSWCFLLCRCVSPGLLLHLCCRGAPPRGGGSAPPKELTMFVAGLAPGAHEQVRQTAASTQLQ